MKSQFAKFKNPEAALESALRKSGPDTEFPATLHNSIMRAVHAARRERKTRVSAFAVLQRFAEMRWLRITGLAALILLGIWLSIHNRPQRMNSNTQSLPEISTALTASQEIVDALPSATIGPLSDELDKVNRDFNRTAEFVLAALP